MLQMLALGLWGPPLSPNPSRGALGLQTCATTPSVTEVLGIRTQALVPALGALHWLEPSPQPVIQDLERRSS